jgi:transposase
VSDEEWMFVAPYLTLMREDAPQREYALRDVFDGLRWIVRAGAAWRMMPGDLPPWEVVYQQTQRWLAAGVFEAIVQDLRVLLRLAEGRSAQPSAAIFDSRTLQSSPESGGRAGYDGAKRRKGSKVHVAVDTLGHLLALHVTPANEQDRAQMTELAQAVQQATQQNVELAYVDAGYTGERAREDAQAQAQAQGIHLEVVKLPQVRKGFVLLPATQKVGGRAFVRLGGEVPTARQGLRTSATNLGGPALPGFRHPAPVPFRQSHVPMCLTPSSGCGVSPTVPPKARVM